MPPTFLKERLGERFLSQKSICELTPTSERPSWIPNKTCLVRLALKYSTYIFNSRLNAIRNISDFFFWSCFYWENNYATSMLKASVIEAFLNLPLKPILLLNRSSQHGFFISSSRLCHIYNYFCKEVSKILFLLHLRTISSSQPQLLFT